MQKRALDPADYLGRVEEISDGGEITARLWEYPSGCESVVILREEQLDEPTHPGAALRIWTWMEWPRDAEAGPEPRLYIEVRNKELSDAERTEIAALVASRQSGEQDDGF